MSEAPELPEERYPDLLLKLKPEEQLFVSEFIIDGNAGRAALESGLSPTLKSSWTIGWRALKNVEINRAIKAGRKLLAEHSMITKEEVLMNLRQVAAKALDGEGGGFPDRRAAVAAWELIAKMLGYIPDKNAMAAQAASGQKFIVNIFNQLPQPNGKLNGSYNGNGKVVENTPNGGNGFSMKLANPSETPT